VDGFLKQKHPEHENAEAGEEFPEVDGAHASIDDGNVTLTYTVYYRTWPYGVGRSVFFIGNISSSALWQSIRLQLNGDGTYTLR
jgi:hypothetical protein